VTRIVSVVFRGGGKVYQFDAGTLELDVGDHVIVDTARGLDFGRVVRAPDEAAPGEVKGGLKRVTRKANAHDLETVSDAAAVEQEARVACRELARELGLAMKVVGASRSFDGGRLSVTFFAEERIDFRELARRLNDRLERRVELKQISARDEARTVGGYGPCGRSLCCSTFAGDQDPVSIRMAKDQNLPLNPAKISGCCGRLMCCLKYEHGVYTSFKSRAPRKGAVVVTPAGEGRVIDLLASADSVIVDLGEGQTATYRLADLPSRSDSEE
jgi:cell fate regulator YaaT (PSP1 superfamily)